jgi:CubicO group peptidase (beta-lactamase class C family)
MSVALVEGTAPIWAAAYGVTDRSSLVPVRVSTVFEGASLMKPLIAYGVLLLVQDGRLDLDRPLDSYLPEAYLPHDPAAATITARMVLAHTTGYPNWRPAGQPLTLLRPPGSGFGYSGEGYFHLVRVIEQVTAQSSAVFLSERVLRPLGMADSGVTWSAAFEQRAACGHTTTGVAVPKEKPAEGVTPAGFHVTATDYARFVALLLKPAGGGPLGIEGLGAMVTPQVQLPGPLAWGLGWGLNDDGHGEPTFWQWGDNYGFKAFVAGSRGNGAAVVVLINSDNGLNVAKPCVNAIFPTLQAPFEAVPDIDRYTRQ